jgi:hypothetical protein
MEILSSITISKIKKKLLKVFKRKKKIKENYDLKKISVISVLFLL